jgi:hypothetical protein
VCSSDLEIKCLYPRTPLLVLSPYPHSDEKLTGHEDQMVRFLVKPVDPVRILEMIRSIIIGESRPA